MGKKARNRRSGREARQRERLAKLQAKADAGTATEEELQQLSDILALDGDDDMSEEEREAARLANEAAREEEGDAAPPVIQRESGLVRYLRGVRLEMGKVTWPTRPELAGYSVKTIALLVLTGVAVWAVDNGLIAAVIAFSGLRG